MASTVTVSVDTTIKHIHTNTKIVKDHPSNTSIVSTAFNNNMIVDDKLAKIRKKKEKNNNDNNNNNNNSINRPQQGYKVPRKFFLLDMSHAAQTNFGHNRQECMYKYKKSFSNHPSSNC